MKRVLITGALGLAGVHLARYLIDRGDLVYGMDIKGGRDDGLVPAELDFIPADLTRPHDLVRSLELSRPDLIFHLGALLSDRGGPGASRRLLDCNVMGTLALLEAAKERRPDARILVASSSAVYGAGDRERIAEDTPLRPVTLYGVSKVMCEGLGAFFARQHCQRVVMARSFNNTAPGEDARMVSSALTAQVVRMERGETQPILLVGRIDTVRDLTDTRDVVRAYAQIIEEGKVGEVYNICSGVGRSIGSIIDTLRAASDVQFQIGREAEQTREAKDDIPYQVGDPSKVQALTGWKASIPFEETIGDLLDYWRRR